MIVRRILAMVISMVLVFTIVGGPASASVMNGSQAFAVHQIAGQPCGKPLSVKDLPVTCASSADCIGQTGVPSAPALLPRPGTSAAPRYWWAARTDCGTAVPPELGPPRLAI